jgi:dihydroorotate dehydrogenase
MYSLLKFFLFKISPEKAHYFTMRMLHLAHAIYPVRWILRKIYNPEDPSLETEFLGIKFPNRLGLAAGFDKDGEHIEVLSNLGFGFIEVGTVTPRPQGGNPQPRLFRLPADNALINRMGFNNKGADALAERLSKLKNREKYIIGANIGKNKDTPNEQATDDYLYCFKKLFPFSDYFVVNVSSPNTPGLRALQEKEPLLQLLNALQQENKAQQTPKPILLKIAPDLTTEQLDDIIDIFKQSGIAGLIATNTTISRANLKTDTQTIESIGNGGLSGAPLTDTATGVIRYLNEKSNGTIPMIGVGGINTAQHAKDKIAAGATLVQFYTGMIYRGPSLIKKTIMKCEM